MRRLFCYFRTMKILSAQQIRAADKYTIENEPIASIDLMERAATRCYEKIVELFPNEQNYHVICGTGNNGGDGLVIARLLHQAGKQVTVQIVRFSAGESIDFKTNFTRVRELGINYKEIQEQVDLALHGGVIIDALLGSGVTRCAAGILAEVIHQLNQHRSACPIISVDFPSGLFDSNNTAVNRSCAVEAHYTITFQVPKLAFLLADNHKNVGEWSVLNIGLNPEYIKELKTPFETVEKPDIKKILHERSPFSHKGTYGHAALVGGSMGKMGAIILASKACLRSGVGLLSVLSPSCGYEILQTSIPEAMTLPGMGLEYLTGDPDLNSFDAVGIGPGMGTNSDSASFLLSAIKSVQKPVVLDADALNILSVNNEIWKYVPEGSVLTPHPKEFERLFGSTKSSFEQLQLARKKAKEHRVIIVLKGRYTATVCGDKVVFNTTGNPGMATGGSGDVLTGIITSLLAQEYPPHEAAKLGVYLHGLAGDLASNEISEEAMMASDLIDHLGDAFKSLHQE